MAQPTQRYKRTLKGSVGAGVQSLISGSGRKYYILEHKVTTKYHKAGESQEIIVDQIELGRSTKCQVRFDETFATVSRRHAAIVKDKDNWKLVQLSQTNPTFLNGKQIAKEWYLQNGDEIQLSTNGPKLGFIIPTGKNATVGSIGLTRRLSLFRNQALRPYKRALAVLGVVLLLLSAGGGYKLYDLHVKNQQLGEDFNKQGLLLAQEIEANKDNQAKADSLSKELVANNEKMADYAKKLAATEKEVVRANQRAAAAWRRAQEAVVSLGSGTEAMKEIAKKTYYCELVIYMGDNAVWGASGTGFLLSNGKFVTAQHVVNPLLYPDVSDQNSCLLNALMHQSPSSFVCKFTAISPERDKITRSFAPNQNPFHMGKYNMEVVGTIEYQGMSMSVKMAKACDNRDYAWIDAGRTGGLNFDASMSTTMPIKTHLDILGYPMGVGAENKSNLSPIFSESSVAREGLDTDGCILLANSETDHGNSGGPVLAVKDGKPVVVGILSGANRLGSKTRGGSAGKWKDRVVPISMCR